MCVFINYSRVLNEILPLVLVVLEACVVPSLPEALLFHVCGAPSVANCKPLAPVDVDISAVAHTLLLFIHTTIMHAPLHSNPHSSIPPFTHTSIHPYPFLPVSMYTSHLFLQQSTRYGASSRHSTHSQPTQPQSKQEVTATSVPSQF